MHYLKRSLLALSLGLNIAFVLFWGMQYFPGQNSTPLEASRPSGDRFFAARYEGVRVTPEQWKKLEPYALAFKTNADRIRRETMQLRKRMLELLAKPVADEKAIRAIQQKISVNQGEMKDEVLRLLLHEKAVLRPDQFSGLLEAIQHYGGSRPGFGAMAGGASKRN
ncbi:Spy/CpxP family protein refolding chaperone [Desulfovibrio sp. Fe33]|uniref:Spy/CpxP family protein refolding chaperone n=1 Tax=Desulfovibrio sp. Fe33 TaxID=3020842 RepID=UPI00234C1A17|nr:periplasmic heavy metal sensor [Desulfovibrio sp. Fe33]